MVAKESFNKVRYVNCEEDKARKEKTTKKQKYGQNATKRAKSELAGRKV